MPPFRLSRWDPVLVAACGGFVLLWWNRYLSPTVGGGHEVFVGREFWAGRLPYRDFYYAAPPAYALWCAAVVGVVGPFAIAFWAAAAVLRVAAAWVLYRWLLRVGPPPAAAAATLAAFVGSCADITDYVAWYNYYPAVWATLIGFCLSKRLEVPGRRGGVWVVAAGGLLGVNFLTKQTAGAGVGLAAVAAAGYALWRARGPRAAVLDVAGMVGAAAVPCAAVLGWLWAVGAFPAYLDQVYLSGPASKGGLLGSLARPFALTWELDGLRAAAVAAAGVVGVVTAARPGRGWAAPVAVAVVAGAALLLVTGGYPKILLDDPRGPVDVAIYAAILGSAGVLAGAFAASVGRPGPVPVGVLHRGLMGAVAVSLAYSLGMSWPAFEPMLVPGLGVCSAVGLGNTGLVLPGVRARFLVAGCCLAVAVAGAARKVMLPSAWGLWSEPPIYYGTTEPAAPALWGFRVSPTTAHFFDRVTAVLADRTEPGDTVFAYPNLPVVYALTDRRPATRCVMHWIDICPDAVAEADAGVIRAAPPKVIVYLAQPDEDLRFNELVYRAGRPSGQRVMVAAIESLLPGYDAVETFGPPSAQVPITVYVRR